MYFIYARMNTIYLALIDTSTAIEPRPISFSEVVGRQKTVNLQHWVRQQKSVCQQEREGQHEFAGHEIAEEDESSLPRRDLRVCRIGFVKIRMRGGLLQDPPADQLRI
jgi:hypothetical protein